MGDRRSAVPGLAPRLLAIAEEIKQKGFQDIVYDIGADHARLPIHLVKNGICAGAVATDVSEKSLERARNNVEAHGLSERIELRCGDGFSAIPDYMPGKILIIAGIGGNNLCDIVRGGYDRAIAAGALILQPMNSQEKLRGWLWRNMFRIGREVIVCEGGRVYSIFSCRFNGAPIIYNDYELYAGMNVIYKSQEDYKRFLRFVRLKIKNRLDGLAASARQFSADKIETDKLHAVMAEIEKRL